MEGSPQNKAPLETLTSAHNQPEISGALKEIFPRRELKKIADDVNMPEEKANEMISDRVAGFTETVFSNSANSPEVILAAFNLVEQSVPESVTKEYKEKYKIQALSALKAKLEGMSEEDVYATLSGLVRYDAVSQLLSDANDAYRWTTDVEELLKQ